MSNNEEVEQLPALPVLPIKNTVLFPHLIMPLSVGRPTSLAAVEAALASEDKTLVVAAQRSAAVDEPTMNDVFNIATKAVIKRMAKSDETIELIVQGIERVVLIKPEHDKPYLKVRVRQLPLPEDLIPRRVSAAGLKADDISIPDETLRTVIGRYTREAGVRQLERALARLDRKIALRFADGQTQAVTIRPDDVADMLGPEKFFLEQARDQLPPGVATGLAWTETGGDVLYVEATLLPGAHGMTLTGQLGAVMQESAKTARSWVWSQADRLGIDGHLFNTSRVHIHGPSFGMAPAGT